jgi:hypothetical protein
MFRPRHYSIILLAILALTAFGIRARLASLPLERDEGEYAYMAQLILDGVPPYQQAFAFKFPGIYLAYAGILAVFGSTDTAIHCALNLITILNALVIFLIGRNVLNRSFGLWASVIYLVMSLSSSVLGLSANAEHFVLCPMLLGLFLLLRERILVAGICFGLAIAMKQQGAAFLLVGLFWLYWMWRNNASETTSVNPPSHRLLLKRMIIFGLGGMLPLAILFLWIVGSGVFSSFYFWCFDYARFYGRMWTLLDGARHFSFSFSAFLRDHAPLVLAAILGFVSVWKKQRTLFWLMLSLLFAGFLATAPGLIFRPHYFLFIIPGVALSAAYFLSTMQKAKWLGILAIVFPLALQAKLFFIQDMETASRTLYPRNMFFEAREVASWIKTSLPEDQRFAVLGSEPQIYFYAKRRSTIPHIYMYPLLEPQPHARELQNHLMDLLEKFPPPYLVHVRVPNSWIVYPNSETKLLIWMGPYLKRNYHRERAIALSGIPGIIPDREMVVYRRL